MTLIPEGVETASASGIRVIPLRQADDLGAIAPDWEALLQTSASDTIFLTPDWIQSWWLAYAAGRELIGCKVEDEGRLIGMGLFVRREERLVQGLRHRTLALVGDGSADSDYLDWISARGQEARVVDAVLGYVRSVPAWDLLRINEVPESSPHVALLESRARSLGWIWSLDRVPCARAMLPETWDDYVKGLKPRMRTKVRSVLREMERSGARYEMAQREEDLERRLESLYDLHNRRWEREGKRGVFHAKEKREFYAALSRRLLARDRLRFYSLRVEDRWVAHQYCFQYGTRMYLLQEGLDPEWFEHGAGNALRAHVFRDSIARGLAAYDFLGGVTPHKLSWGAEVTWSVRITTGPPSIRNRILAATRRARAVAKRILRPRPGGDVTTGEST